MDWGNCVNDKGVATLSCLPKLFQNVIGGLVLLSGITAVVLLIFAGIRYITANADQKQIDSAHQTLMWALIGFVVVLLSFFIINVISFITGAECIVKFPGLGFGACQ